MISVVLNNKESQIDLTRFIIDGFDFALRENGNLDKIDIEYADLRLSLSNLDNVLDTLLDNLDGEIEFYIDGKKVFVGYLDLSYAPLNYKVKNEIIELIVISKAKKLWQMIENLSIGLFKEKSNWLGLTSLFKSFSSILAQLNINIETEQEILFNNADSIARFNNLDNDINLKKFLQSVFSYFNLRAIYDYQNDKIIIRNMIKPKNEMLDGDISDIEVNYSGKFYDWIYIPETAWKPSQIQILEYNVLNYLGLYPVTKYKYLLIEETKDGIKSIPSDVVEYNTPFTLTGQGIALKIKIPWTFDYVTRRYLYRASPYNLQNYLADVFYLVKVFEGNDEIEFWDDIADSKRQFERYDKPIINGYYLRVSDRGIEYTYDIVGGKVYNLFPEPLKFTVGDKTYSDLGFTIKFFEPFGANLDKVINRFSFLFDEFYIFNVTLANPSKIFDLFDLIDISQLKKFVYLKHCSNLGLIMAREIKEDSVRYEIYSQRIKPTKTEL